jgi:hypothetical protein
LILPLIIMIFSFSIFSLLTLFHWYWLLPLLLRYYCHYWYWCHYWLL